MDITGTKGMIDAASGLTKEIGETIDKISTSAEEKLELKDQISNTALSYMAHAMELGQSAISDDAKGNWMQRSWRPLTALCFVFLIMWQLFLGPIIAAIAPGLVMIPLPDQIWTLLTIMIGGYTGLRSIEKVAETVTKNVDLPFMRRRDRRKFAEDQNK